MNYPGSKNGAGVIQTIINQIPPHDALFDCFAGSGALSRMIRPAHVTVVIDVYPSCTNLLRDALPGAVVINDDVITTLRSAVDTCGYPEANCFVYLDPPYLKRDIDGKPVRSWQGDIYKHEFDTVEQHQTLLTLIKSLNCMVMISGYWSKLYANELKDWRTLSYNAMTRAGRVAKEYLWMNYPEPIALHDYAFLGKDRTDRQRIKRKVQRQIKKFENLPMLEKRVLLQAMESFRNS